MNVDVKIDYTRLDTTDRIDKASRLEDDINLIINSDLFRERLLHHLHRTNYRYGETSNWRYKSPIQIYEHIMSGAEELTPETDGIIELIIDDFYKDNNVIGQTNPNTPVVQVNTKYFDVQGDMKSGSNIVHEIFHKLGFKHDFFRTRRRPSSLCYISNKVYEEVWKVYLGKEVTTRVTRRKWYGRRYTVVKKVWVRR